MINLIIRQFEKSDFSTLLVLRIKFAQLEAELDSDTKLTLDVKDKLSKETKESLDSDGFVFLVAESNGKILGYVSIHLYPEVPDIAYIGELFVRKEQRKKGVGKKLVEKAILNCKSQGIEEVRLNTYKNNKNAIEFFENVGFFEHKPKTILMSLDLKKSINLFSS